MRRNECVVIIPAYEPSSNFVDYATKLLKSRIARLIVVNDGSGEKYAPVFDALSALDGCDVISYEKNHGKGYALKTAFRYVKENFDERFTFVTADCDGQHLVKDVLQVASTAAEFGDSFVLGVRDFSKPNVPKRSRMGNVSTRRMFKLLYGVRISDTQTGLRAFPYALLDTLSEIGGDRFEYEMNQLVVLHKRNIAIREVPIDTVYEEKPDDVEKVSHYKTFTDSMRVLKVLLTNLSWFMFASILSAVVELGLHYVGLRYLPEDGFWIIPQAICAMFVARLCSSIVNFAVNYKFVFNGHSKKSIFRYYLLWTFLFATSLGFSQLFDYLFTKPIVVVLMTGLSTLVMSIFSYQVQTRWVFAGGKRLNGKFFGLYGKFARFGYKLFTPHYTSLVAQDPLGAVYVCRHLNMHGPLTTAAKIGFDVHMFAFSVLCHWKECFRHFRDYNFSVLMKMKKVPATILAFFSATLLIPLTRSIEAIPVYRKSTDSIITMKRALKYLEAHESVIIYPDIEYTAGQDEETDIYSGFLFLERIYYKKFGKHLRFIPLVIDEENRTIVEKPPIRFRNGDYKSQVPEIKEKIMRAIGCIKEDSSAFCADKFVASEKATDAANASLSASSANAENARGNAESENAVSPPDFISPATEAAATEISDG